MIHSQSERSKDSGASAPVPDAARRRFLKQSAAMGLAWAFAGELITGDPLHATAQSPAQKPADPSKSREEKKTMGKMQAMTDFYPGAVNGDGAYVLPPLPYDYKALEPHIDEETMHLHHDKHHKAYVDGLIKAEADLAKAREAGDFAMIDTYLKKASFHGGGHFLHCLFWAGMSPKESKPSAEMQQAIDQAFGSQKTMIDMLGAATKSVEGSGWGILAWSIPAKKLVVVQCEKHNLLTQWAEAPLLVIDAWEHAYYKKYANDRAAFVNAVSGILNWESASARYAELRECCG